MRIPGQRHRAHCSTALAGSQKLVPESQQPHKLPSLGQLPRRPPPVRERLPFWTGPPNHSQLLFCGSWGGTRSSASTPTSSTPAYPHLFFFSHPAPAGEAPSERSTPATLHLQGSGDRETAATCCLAAGAPEASAAPGGTPDVREAVWSHDLLHRSAGVRTFQHLCCHCRRDQLPPPHHPRPVPPPPQKPGF